MQDVHTVVVAIVAFIVLVGLMVVVHEFGHFALAKFFGVRVESFSVGFGPRLFGFKYGDTDYKISLLPLGGYVKMTGEAPEQNLETPGTQAEVLPDDPGSFLNHPRWQRVLIGLAGPVSNFILAFVLMVFYFGFINEVPKYETKTTTIEWVTPGSAADQAGFKSGDVIRRFDNVDNPNWDQVNMHAAGNMGQAVPVTVDRGGQSVTLTFQLPATVKSQDFDISDTGALPQFVPGPIWVDEVQPGMPAEQAGLRAGDAIQSVDGHAFHNVTTLLAYMQDGQGKPVTLEVLRKGVLLPPMVAHPSKLDTGWKLGFAPVPIPFRNNPLPLIKAIDKSTAFCADNSTLIVEVLGRIFTHKVAVSQLSGPVGIARMAGQAAEMNGWMPKFGLAAAISLNLGILNLLPFPILDGGGIFLLLIESVMRRDISINVKERIFQAAFVVLLAFFAFVIFNDVTRLPIFAHLKP
jgi:regulator of sigma E protease